MHTESPQIDNSSEQHREFVIGKKVIAEQFIVHRERLLQTARFRLDPRLHGRIDAEDVVQEAYIDAVKRQTHFHDELSLFVQIRQIVLQTLIDVHRRHLEVKARDVKREQSVVTSGDLSRTSFTLARLLQATVSSPSAPIRRAETINKLYQALESLSEIDCEVLLMRHFEDMTNSEVAESLGINVDTACQRYIRALARLKTILESQSHFQE